MPATPRSQKHPASSRRLIGAALGLTLVVAAAPFLNSANAAQPTTDAQAAVETAPVSANGTANDTAIWVHPTDPAQSLVLGANGVDGVGVYGLDGAKKDQPDIDAIEVTGVDTRNGFMLGGSASSIATAVGETGGVHGLLHFYAIDPATGKLSDKSALATPTAKGVELPAWGSGKVSSVCMYRSPVSNNTYAFAMSANGEIGQLQLIEDAGKIKVQMVRGYRSTPQAARWDINGTNATTMGSCVVDDEMKTLYVSEKETGIWKFGAEPTDPMTGTMIDTPTTATPAGHLTDRTLGLALAKTGDGAGYLIASSPASDPANAAANSFMVYDRAGANAFIRSFHVANGALDACEKTDGIDAAVGNLGATFASGLFVCMDNKNTNSGAPNGQQNYKLIALQQVADLTPPVSPTVTSAPEVTTTTAPIQVGPTKSGYWMVGTDGKVFAFGEAKTFGNADLPTGAQAVDLEPTPSGNGYWIIDDLGNVYARGDAAPMATIDRKVLSPAEVITSLSATKDGKGYWIFTSLGRVIPFGNAVFHGDMSSTKLNGPVLDSIPTASGKGYYMVGSDGGIFSFGDAAFFGSMGATKLNKPVQSLVPDSDGVGYWLVASDGGIFAFEAPFKGSLGSVKLNKPITGMVRYGDAYLMVGEDGGIFNFSNKEFSGSLGASPPAKPITSVAVLELRPAV